MKTILVPTDFSPVAVNAATYAAALAKQLHARVLLLHTYHLPLFAKDTAAVITDTDAYSREHEASLKEEAKRLHAQFGVDVKYRIKLGFLVDEILEAEKETSLVVMGLNGAGRLSELVMGSMATATVHKSKKPVLVVPEKATFTGIKKIVFACDYDPYTDVNALNALKELVNSVDAELYVVNVQHENETAIPSGSIDRKVERKLTNVQHIYSFPHNENVVEALNEFVDEHKADMLALIPHHYNLLDKMFHPSFTKKMAFRSHVPLLALPESFASLPGYVL
jgi:nucleotide-binding universal stress UspA family protein